MAYLKPARGRPNLEVVTRAQATRVVFQDRRATAVEYRLGGRDITPESITEAYRYTKDHEEPEKAVWIGLKK